MKRRTLTGCIITVIMVAVLLLSHISWLLNLIIALLSWLAIYELYKALNLLKYKAIYPISGIIGTVIAFLPSTLFKFILFFAFPTAILLFSYLMTMLDDIKHIPTWVGVVIALLFILFFKSMSCIRRLDKGFYLLCGAILVSSITDIFAYLIGKSCGERKIFPKISPNKTLAGSIGGTVFCVLLLMLVSLALHSAKLISIENVWLLALYLLLASVVGQFGDLALSTLKRIVKIKDYGKLLPGHGGILDRFDSSLFVLPFTYLFFTFSPVIIL